MKAGSMDIDMIFFDYFLLMKFHSFQHYFPAASALAAWICTLFYGG